MRVSEREKGREDMRLRDSRIREFLKNTKENELENCEEKKMHYLPVAIGIRSRAPVFEFALLILI